MLFRRDWPAKFNQVTYPASGASTQYISDLTPGKTYAIAGDGAPATATADTAGVLVFGASGAGEIKVATVK